MVTLACMMRTPVDPQSEIRGTIYDIDGIAPGFLRERRLWEDRIPTKEDEARTSGGGGGSETGTWKTVDNDGRFPSLVDLFLRPLQEVCGFLTFYYVIIYAIYVTN